MCCLDTDQRKTSYRLLYFAQAEACEKSIEPVDITVTPKRPGDPGILRRRLLSDIW